MTGPAGCAVADAASTGTTVAAGSTAAAAAAAGAAATSIPISTGIFAGAVSGAAGSLAGQAVGSFTGVSSFDWRNVVAGGITGAISGDMYAQWGSVGQALEKTQYVKAGLLAVGGSAAAYVGQKGAGLDVGFSWRGIAANALGNLVSAQISKSIGLPPGKDFGGSGNFGADLVNGVIGGVVSVHTRRAFGFDDKIDYGMIALDAFGNAVGNAVVSGISNLQINREIGTVERQRTGGRPISL